MDLGSETSKLKRLKLRVREIEILVLIDRNGKHHHSIPIESLRTSDGHDQIMIEF